MSFTFSTTTTNKGQSMIIQAHQKEPSRRKAKKFRATIVEKLLDVKYSAHIPLKHIELSLAEGSYVFYEKQLLLVIFTDTIVGGKILNKPIEISMELEKNKQFGEMPEEEEQEENKIVTKMFNQFRKEINHLISSLTMKVERIQKENMRIQELIWQQKQEKVKHKQNAENQFLIKQFVSLIEKNKKQMEQKALKQKQQMIKLINEKLQENKKLLIHKKVSGLDNKIERVLDKKQQLKAVYEDHQIHKKNYRKKIREGKQKHIKSPIKQINTKFSSSHSQNSKQVIKHYNLEGKQNKRNEILKTILQNSQIYYPQHLRKSLMQYDNTFYIYTSDGFQCTAHQFRKWLRSMNISKEKFKIVAINRCLHPAIIPILSFESDSQDAIRKINSTYFLGNKVYAIKRV